jgi:hypothetical protein
MDGIANWAGLLMALAGLLLATSAFRRRTAALSAAARGEVAPPLNPSLAVLGEIATPVVLGGTAIAGGQVALAFYMTNGGGVFSPLDLAGFLFLLAAYAVWVLIRTRHRVTS